MTLTIYWKKKPFQVMTVDSIQTNDASGFVYITSKDADGPCVFALNETHGIAIAP